MDLEVECSIKDMRSLEALLAPLNALPGVKNTIRCCDAEALRNVHPLLSPRIALLSSLKTNYKSSSQLSISLGA